MDYKEAKAIDHWLEKTDEYYQDGELHVSHFVIEGYKAGFDAGLKERNETFFRLIILAIGLGYMIGQFIPAVEWF